MSARKRNVPARARRAPLPRGKARRDDLREANRQLLTAGLEASAQADAQTSLASAMRLLLEGRDEKEQGLRAEYQLLRSITDTVTSALFLVDGRGDPIFINPAAEVMFGYTLAEMAQAPIHVAIHHHYPDGRPFPIEDCVIETALTNRTPMRGHRDIFVRKDGTFLAVQCDIGPLEIAGERLGAVLEIRDRSVEERAEEAKRDYVALIAHDLRTPLTAVRGQAELLQRRSKRRGDGDGGGSLESIVANARRMEAMIQDLIESSQLESGALLLRRTPIDLSRLAADVVAQVVSVEERKRIRVIAPARGPRVSADAARIERVLMNLLQNAVKYSAPRAPIELEVRQAGDEVVVSVIDHGAGIPVDLLPRLFQRFSRIRRVEADPGGFGLGLYIARLIVEAHGGRVWAESAVGSGSRIGFSLPLGPSSSR
ncbi:MAG: ATP-binding protein [Chloroflexota bacterium]|nr:ATP-binding protein [Chloroflexota bacterium]